MRYRLAGVLTFATLLGAAPLRADVTAQYLNREGQPFRTIEVDDRGNVRVGDGMWGYYLATPAGEYLVEPGPGGPTVITLEAAIALAAPRLRERGPMERALWRFAPTGTAQVGPWTGRAYRAAGEGLPPLPPAVVISDDPRLAPLGRAQLRDARAKYAAARRPDADDEYAELLSGGALLATSFSRIDAVSFEPIPPERFALPAKPITLEEVAAIRDLPESPVPAEGRRLSVIQAVFFDGQLWTLDDGGGLASTPDGGSERTAAEVPERPIALCRADDALWLITQPAAEAPYGLWLRRAGGTWNLQGRVPASPTSRFVGAECSGELPLLLFSDRIVEGAARRVMTFDPETLPPGSGFSSLALADGALYLAMNNGEWGGGIHRVTLPSRASGEQVARVEPLCGPAQRSACGAVTGLAPDPARPGCLLASVGLVHFFPSGEVVRVCGTSVERIYRKPYTIDPDWADSDADNNGLLGTVPFFALAGGRGGAWAVAADGVYRFGSGEPQLRRFPSVPPATIDWSQPGVVLVPTDMNGRHSLSGGSYLLAVR